MWASGGTRDASLRVQRQPRCIPAAEATVLYPHRVVEPRCIPADPRQCQPVQKTGVVALQFCGVSKADIQGSQAEREGPCRRRGEAVPIGAGVYISAHILT